MPSVLLATCAEYPSGDEDGPAMLAALDSLGVDARWVAWDDPAADWDAAPVVLRSTWDYTQRQTEFLDWVSGLASVWNPADVVAWNSDKVYLHDLIAAGVPATPTVAAAPGEPVQLPAEGAFVVKPSVGAGSRGAGRFRPDQLDAAREHAAALHAAGRTVLVQPYLSGVEDAGETALVYVDGAFSHAFGKGAMLRSATAYSLDETRGLFIEENISAREPSAAERAVGEQAMDYLRARFGGELLYARVDLLPSRSGPLVVELEVTEPSLMLSFGAGATERFAAAVAARL